MNIVLKFIHASYKWCTRSSKISIIQRVDESEDVPSGVTSEIIINMTVVNFFPQGN